MPMQGGSAVTGSDSTQIVVEAFALFRNERRSRILAVVAGTGAPTDCETIASAVYPQLSTPKESQEDFEQTLHHTHLPAIAEASVITYDNEQRRVTTFDGDQLREFLEAVQSLLESVATELEDESNQ